MNLFFNNTLEEIILKLLHPSNDANVMKIGIFENKILFQLIVKD
jgi:hypothetical protein